MDSLLERRIMKIYKIQYILNERIRRGKNRGRIERYENKDEIVVDNYQSAVQTFKDFERRWRNQVDCYDYFGFVEVFEPHISEHGTMMSWPDRENYIARTQKEDGGQIITTHELKEEKFFVTKGELNDH